jgi:hypothetical protein
MEKDLHNKILEKYLKKNFDEITLQKLKELNILFETKINYDKTNFDCSFSGIEYISFVSFNSFNCDIIKKIKCCNNQIKFINNIPTNLEWFDCSHNSLIMLPNIQNI